MPLVPTTKMADAHKYSVSGNHWPGEPRDQCLKLRPHLNFVPRFFGADSKTRIFYKYFVFKHSVSFFPISIAALTHSLQWDSFIHQLTLKATKWINHANILFLNIPCLWDFFLASKTATVSNHRKKRTFRNTQSTRIGHFYY